MNIQEQISRIKGMMGVINEQTSNVDSQSTIDKLNQWLVYVINPQIKWGEKDNKKQMFLDMFDNNQIMITDELMGGMGEIKLWKIEDWYDSLIMFVDSDDPDLKRYKSIKYKGVKPNTLSTNPKTGKIQGVTFY